MEIVDQTAAQCATDYPDKRFPEISRKDEFLEVLWFRIDGAVIIA